MTEAEAKRAVGLGGAPQGPAIDYAPPVWPVVIAVYSVVSGGLGLLAATASMLTNPMFFLDLARPGASGLPTYLAVNCLLDLATYALLPLVVAAGLLLLKRHRLGRTLHVLWAVLVTPIALAAMAQAATQFPDDSRYWQVPVLVRALSRIVYPIFLLVWLTHAPVRRQMERWVACTPVYPQPIWPAVIGVLAILEAARDGVVLLGRISYGLNRIRYLWTGWTPCYTAVDVLGPLLGALLLAGGLALRRQRRIARKRLLLWAVLVIGTAFLRAVFGGLSYTGQGPLDTSRWLVTATLQSILPVFVLIWFHRPSIRQQVDQWRQW